MINKSDKEFTDISSELWREYDTPYGTLRIDNPMFLSVTDNGHRVFDANNIAHYIDTRWGFFLKWESRAGEPNFVA